MNCCVLLLFICLWIDDELAMNMVMHHDYVIDVHHHMDIINVYDV